MSYEEFKDFQLVYEKDEPFIPHFIIDKENDFYLEPLVYTQLQGFKERHKDQYQRIIDAMIERVRRNHKVYFISDYESYFDPKEGYIYLEIQDITDPLKIFVEDKSRGSDYGD